MKIDILDSSFFNKILLIVNWSACLVFLFGTGQLHAQDKTFRVAGLQMNVSSDIDANKKTILNSIVEASKNGAEFLITPEGSLSGYTDDFDNQKLMEALAEVEKSAKDEGIGLFLGTCIKEKIGNDTIVYNQVRAYSPEGPLLGKQSKVLLCSPIDAPGTGEMHDYGQGFLEPIQWNGLKIGILICNDLWATPGYTTIANTYLPLQLKQMGAEVIFHSINSGLNQRYRKFHESSVELWAYTNGIPILEVNAAKGERPVNAQSGLVDKNGERTLEVPLVGEQLFYAEIPFPLNSQKKSLEK